MSERYALELVTAPTAYPVELSAFMRGHLRDTWAESISNADIQKKLNAAIEYVQDTQDRQLCTATYKVYFDGFPSCAYMRIPRAPLASVTHVKYYDTSNTQQTWASSNYDVDAASQPGRIHRGYGVTWPSTYDRPNAVEVQYVCGYASAGLIPYTILAYIDMLAATLCEYREEYITGTIVSRVDAQMDRLAWKDRLVCFA